MSGVPSGHVLISGGAGFIGTNLADRLARNGRDVVVYDNLSRPGVEKNVAYLKRKHPLSVTVQVADVRDAESLRRAVAGAESVYHLAAQVAVTTSMEDPVLDFDVNARGTLNLLEAIRRSGSRAPLIYTSTNKVLGGLDDLVLRETDSRYVPTRADIAECGIGEARGIDFCSPYGCSKGAADQYVLDYARNFGLRSVVFRMSCVYGPHQCGNEDQGWVAHFVKQAIQGSPITFYGDGKQVRDALYVDDLVDAFLLARESIDRISGRAFNLGGGPARTASLRELVDAIAEIHGAHPEIRFEDWRPSDQRYYVSDTRKFEEMTGWSARVGVSEGVKRLYHWLLRSRSASRVQSLRQPLERM